MYDSTSCSSPAGLQPCHYHGLGQPAPLYSTRFDTPLASCTNASLLHALPQGGSHATTMSWANLSPVERTLLQQLHGGSVVSNPTTPAPPPDHIMQRLGNGVGTRRVSGRRGVRGAAAAAADGMTAGGHALDGAGQNGEGVEILQGGDCVNQDLEGVEQGEGGGVCAAAAEDAALAVDAAAATMAAMAAAAASAMQEHEHQRQEEEVADGVVAQPDLQRTSDQQAAIGALQQAVKQDPAGGPVPMDI